MEDTPVMKTSRRELLNIDQDKSDQTRFLENRG